MAQEKNYRRFSDRVCNLREAGFIGIGFVIAAVVVAAIIVGIYLGTQCSEGQVACRDGYTCVDKKKVCDQVRDCPIGDDEWSCHPKDFYVAIRTKKERLIYPGLFPPPNSSVTVEEGTPYATELKGELERTIRESLVQLPAVPNQTDPVNVFRFRQVNNAGEQGLEYPYIAADAIISFDKTVPIGEESNQWVQPGQIRAALEQSSIGYFDPPGRAVTTGVGVILYGPETCSRPRVFCDKYCDLGYLYGSTKGCPEYPCACVKPPE